MPAGPFPPAELDALLADGQEVVGEQGVQLVGVAVQHGVIEGLRKLKDVIGHSTHPARKNPARDRRAL